MYLGVLLLGFILFRTLGFLDLGSYFLPHFRKIFNYYLLKYYVMPFPIVFFWDTYDLNVQVFNIVPEISEAVLISFYYLLCSASFISTTLSSNSLMPFFFLKYYTFGSL